MVPITPPDPKISRNTLNIINGDAALLRLTLELHYAQVVARSGWTVHPTRLITVEGVSEVVLVNGVNRDTVIPSYTAYGTTWRSAGYMNPFDVLWLDYDQQDRLAARYIQVVIGTLNEQLELWKDDEAKLCPVYTHVERFVESLERLYSYKWDGQFTCPVQAV